jgi:hypothetical protein
MVGIKNKLLMYQRDCVNTFKMDCSTEDIKINPEVKKLAKYINRQGRTIDKIVRLLTKLNS